MDESVSKSTLRWEKPSSGVFDGAMDTFDGNRHKLNVNLTKGMLLRDIESQVAIEKTGTITPQPQILEVKYSVSGKVNEILTPGGVLELWGNNIKIAGDNPECVLYFAPATGDPVKAQVIVQNKPLRLIVMISALPAGTYTVKVETQYTGGKPLKEPRFCTFSKTLLIG